MTVLEALNIDVGNEALSNKNLILIGLDPVTEFSSDNNSEVELAKAYCFKSIATSPDFSEDGLQITYDRKYLIEEANRIFELNNLPDEVIGSGKPEISNKTRLW